MNKIEFGNIWILQREGHVLQSYFCKNDALKF